MSALDPHLLATLDPSEREALDSTEYSPDDADRLRAVAGSAADADADADNGADDDDGDPDETLDADGNVIAPGPAAAAPAPAPAAAAPAASAPAPAAQAPAAATAPAPADDDDAPELAPAVVYTATLPEDYDDQVKAVRDEAKALTAKLKSGDIDADAYEQEQEKLNERRDALASLKLKAEMADEMNQQAAATAWNAEINALYRRAAKEAVDYTKDEVRRADLDTFVKMLANNPATADWSMRRYLDEAHKRVMALHGPVGTTAAPAPAPGPAAAAATTQKPAAPAPRTPPVAAVPKGLADVPGGDGPGDLEGEFAELDRLEGEALETAIAAMTPAQRERYQRGQ